MSTVKLYRFAEIKNVRETI